MNELLFSTHVRVTHPETKLITFNKWVHLFKYKQMLALLLSLTCVDVPPHLSSHVAPKKGPQCMSIVHMRGTPSTENFLQNSAP